MCGASFIFERAKDPDRHVAENFLDQPTLRIMAEIRGPVEEFAFDNFRSRKIVHSATVTTELFDPDRQLRSVRYRTQ